MKKTKSTLFVHVLIFTLLGSSLLLFKLFGKPYIQGYRCDDETIFKPYHTSTVPMSYVYFAYLVVAVLCFSIGIGRQRRTIQEEEGFVLNNNDVKIIWFDVVLLFSIFVYGTGLNAFVTDIGKYSLGRLRPHYISVCLPDWSMINCTSANITNSFVYGDEACTSNDYKRIKEARLSFPSGHSSFVGFATVFLVLYMENQIACNKWEIVPKYLVQTLIGSAAFFVALSRINDNFHHPTDVLVGLFLGSVIAGGMYFSLAKYFFNTVNHEVTELRKLGDY